MGGISRLDTKISVGLERAECGQFVDRVDPARPRGTSGSYASSSGISQRDPARPDSSLFIVVGQVNVKKTRENTQRCKRETHTSSTSFGGSP